MTKRRKRLLPTAPKKPQKKTVKQSEQRLAAAAKEVSVEHFFLNVIIKSCVRKNRFREQIFVLFFSK